MPRSTKANAEQTRLQLLTEARCQFAARGFHGTSIASVATAVGVTKQTLLHHFGSKEQLFSEVLGALATRLAERVEQVRSSSRNPASQLETFLLETLDADSLDQLQLVIRELLENQDRASTAGQWHLKNYLEALTELVKAVPGNDAMSHAEAFAFLYQLLGAVSYFRISRPTLHGMYGARETKAIDQAFRRSLKAMLASRNH